MTAPPTRTDWFAEVKAHAPQVADVATALGFVVRGRRWGPCPACNTDTPHHPACTFRHGGLGWMCSRCKETGDALTLVAIAQAGTRKPVGAQWAEVRAWFARAGLCTPDGDRPVVVRPMPVRPPPVEVPYPDADELAHFLTLGGPVEDDPEVAAFWHARGFGARTGATWALSERARWPAWWPLGYRSLYRLACPMYDARGVVRSVHARAVRDPGTWPDGKPRMKTCAPKGVRGDSLLFADPWIAVPMLRGERVSCDILTIEGITDNCAVTSVALPGLAILGGISGSFKALADVRLPPGCVVFVGTDNDPAGDKYAAEVVAAIGDRAECRRVVWGIRGQDASDIVTVGVDVRVRLGAATPM